MKFNPNEKKYVEKMINDEMVFNLRYPKNDVRLLIRYFTSIGLTEKDVLFNVISFMNNVSSNKKDWEIDVNKCYKELSKKSLLTKPLSNVEVINITKNEMNKIEELNNENLEKVAFGLLVYCKIWQQINNKKDSCWVRIDNTTDFYKDIKVSVCAKDREINIHKLLKYGFIDVPRKTGSTDIKLNFISDDTDLAIAVSSIDDFIIDYYVYKGKKVINCCECGQRVIVNGKARTKYCSKCAKVVEKTRLKETMNVRRSK